MQEQNQFNQPQPQQPPKPDWIPTPPPLRQQGQQSQNPPPAPGAYGGTSYGAAPQPQPSAPQPLPTLETRAPLPHPYSAPPQPMQPAGPLPQPGKKGKLPLIIFGAIGIIFVIGLVMVFKPSGKTSSSKNSNTNTPQSVKLVTYKDPASGMQFSYKQGWHFSSLPSSKPAGQVIYLAPNVISTDSSSLKQKHLDDPELVFYIYDSNPVPGHDTLPITSPLKKLGELELATTSIVATVVSDPTGQGRIVTLSACQNALCIFKVGSRYISPTIQTLGTVAGQAGHNVDTTSADYQSELKVWQFIKY